MAAASAHAFSIPSCSDDCSDRFWCCPVLSWKFLSWFFIANPNGLEPTDAFRRGGREPSCCPPAGLFDMSVFVVTELKAITQHYGLRLNEQPISIQGSLGILLHHCHSVWLPAVTLCTRCTGRMPCGCCETPNSVGRTRMLASATAWTGKGAESIGQLTGCCTCSTVGCIMLL